MPLKSPLGHLTSQTVWSLALKVLGAGVSFTSAVILARNMGVEGYGAYTYATAWLNLLGGLCVLGADNMLIRQVAVYRGRASWGLLRGLLSWVGRAGLAISLGVALPALVIISEYGPESESARLALGFAIVSLPVAVLARMRQATLLGFGHPLSALVPEGVLQPAAFLVLVLFFTYGIHDQLGAPSAVLLSLLAAVLSFGMGMFLLMKAMPSEVRSAEPVFERHYWAKNAAPLAVLGSLGAIGLSGPTIVLGMLGREEDVGIFVATERLASLISFMMIAANAVLAPVFARMHDENDHVRLERLAIGSAQGLFLAALPPATLYYFAGGWVLSIFGEAFVGGEAALSILTTGQLVNLGTGPVAYLLMMTGASRQLITGSLIGTAVNLLLSFALIPLWGLEGAAVASAASTILINGFFAVVVFRKMGIAPTMFGSLWRRL